MHQWYLSFDGQQVGPVDQAAAGAQAAAHPDAYCWREGFAEWMPVRQVAELTVQPARHGAPAPPPPPMSARTSDEIDFQIHGGDMQYVEIELDPGESAVAEAGAMMYKDHQVAMDTVFGDGSTASGQSGGVFDALVGAGKRLVTGESLFTTVFTHAGPAGKAHVAFAAPYPGTILPVTLANFDHQIICQKDCFLAAAKGVSIGIHFQKKVLTALFGGEGFIMQKLEGDGLVFLHAGGSIHERELAPGEILQVDTGCLVALSRTVTYDIEQVGGVKSMLFAGEGLFFAKLTGPGKVWLQSLPFSRLARRMLAAAPQSGGTRRGEGSVLGGLGDLIGGDNRF